MDLTKLFGGATAAKCLLFIARYDEATSSQIATAFSISKTQVFVQLSKFEDAGILAARSMGNAKIYAFNPRSGIKNELKSLLERYIAEQMAKSEHPGFYLVRRRPRSKGKKLGGAYAK